MLSLIPCLSNKDALGWKVKHPFDDLMEPKSLSFDDICYIKASNKGVNERMSLPYASTSMGHQPNLSFPSSLTYLYSRVVAALLHMQQSAALGTRPELNLQAAGTGGVSGGALQRPSEEDVTFWAPLQWVVQTAGAIQGQGGVRCHVCGRKERVLSPVGLCQLFTADCKTYISTSELADPQV